MKRNELAFLGWKPMCCTFLHSNSTVFTGKRTAKFQEELITVLVKCLQTTVLYSSVLLVSFIFFGPKSI